MSDYVWCTALHMSDSLALSHRQSSLKSAASCSLPMTRKSAKTTASSPPIRTAEGKTKSQSGQASWLLPLLLQQLFRMGRGGSWKEIGFAQRENDEKKRGEKEVGWLTQEEDHLFSVGQMGLSSTFTYGDEPALCERRVRLVCLSAPESREKNTGGNGKWGLWV